MIQPLTGTASAQPASAAATAAPAAPTSAQGASALAVRSGQPVEVVSERSEYTRTEANPDGTFTITQSTAPQRAKDGNGNWRDVDVTLVRRPDGTIGPKASVVDLSFSGGSDGKDMIRLAGDQGSVTLGWPERLPRPTLDGPTATYPEVFDGVDLQLTATAEGYREVLVVKSAQAAANPELNTVELTATGDGLRVAPAPGGGLRALDENGNTVFHGPAGLMWDSAGGSDGTGDSGVQPQMLRRAVTAAGPAATTQGPSPEAGAGPADAASSPEAASPDKGDTTAVLPVQVSSGQVAVTPDMDVLRGEDTVYPVYIDPSMGLGVSERTVLSSDGDTFWNFNGDYGVGNCNRVGPWYCGSNYTNRMYFEFAPTKLAGKYVIDATFRAYETWSFSCTPQWVDLWRTDNISSSTDWPGPDQLDLMVDRQISAGRGDACDPDQPDSWIDFHDAGSESDENLTKTVRSFADGNFSRLTLMLRAKDEGNPDAWKRFEDNAELKVVYALKPGVPTYIGVIPGSGTVPGCGTTEATAETATREDPYLQAMAQTAVTPASWDERGSLRVYHHAEKKQNNGTWATAWEAEDPPTGYQIDNYLSKRRMNPAVDGSMYRVKFWTKSFWTYNGKLNGLSSSPTVWCYFTFDTAAPKEPRITSNGPYEECTTNDCPSGGGPGIKGSFTLKPHTADKDITGYRWRLLTERADDTHREDKVGSDGSVTIRPVPTTSGTQVLRVEAIDVRDRTSAPAEFHFKVKSGEKAVGRWHFGENTGTTAADSADAGSARHPITLHQRSGKAASWSVRGRLGPGDHSLRLNEDVDDDPDKQTGYASTTTAPVNTKDSFTVSAWVSLTDGAGTRVVASAPGEHKAAAFNLFYSGSTKKWVFNRAVADSDKPEYVSSVSDAPGAPLNVWTHLTGVFDTKKDTDESNDTIQLFVNGRPQGSPVRLKAANADYEPWTSGAGMTIGASAAGEYFKGNVDELAVWQRGLDAGEVRGEHVVKDTNGVTATELVAHWDTAATANGTIADATPYAPDMKISGTGAVAAPTKGEVRLDGASGYLFADGPVVDETGSFTVSASVKLDKAKFEALPVGTKAYVFGQATPEGKQASWALWVEKPSTSRYTWHFGRTATDATGKVIATGSVTSEAPADLGTWVQVTGVFDAAEEVAAGYGSTHLYVGAAQQMSDSDADFPRAQQGRGQITAGRAPTAGATDTYLPGALQETRVWVGAIPEDEISAKVMGDTSVG
ncbi:LamG domain-containing protein [Streptomyces sp. NPDC059828]|uniref:LamG domain-containing protein n=1 Tax=Streptomyces sp. NPDC059828 TaxID=3346965 RepID=UPI0036559DBD